MPKYSQKKWLSKKNTEVIYKAFADKIFKEITDLVADKIF